MTSNMNAKDAKRISDTMITEGMTPGRYKLLEKIKLAANQGLTSVEVAIDFSDKDREFFTAKGYEYIQGSTYYMFYGPKGVEKIPNNRVSVAGTLQIYGLEQFEFFRNVQLRHDLPRLSWDKA